MLRKTNPTCRRDYLHLGYTFKKVTQCRQCGAPVEAWITHKNNSVLFDLTPNQSEITPVTCHFATCPERKRRNDDAPDPNETRRRNAVHCRSATSALAVLVVYGDGQWAADVEPTLSAEDVRHELITGANLLKRAMEAR